MSDQISSTAPFFKNLASSDRRTRAAAVTSLRSYLTARCAAISETDALKLWQGLFYALWMADRVPAQQAMCSDFGSLVHLFPAATVDTPSSSAAALWLRAFWAVMARRWTEIDAHRMDKFLLLTRRVLAGSLARCHAAVKGPRREAELVVLSNSLANGGPFDAGSDLRQVPVGLRLHVLDIWVDECEREGLLAQNDDEEAEAKPNGGNDSADARKTTKGKASPSAPANGDQSPEEKDNGIEVAKQIESLVEAVLRECHIKPAKARAREGLEDERLWWRRAAEDGSDDEMGQDGSDDDGDDDSEDDGWGGFKD